MARTSEESAVVRRIISDIPYFSKIEMTVTGTSLDIRLEFNTSLSRGALVTTKKKPASSFKTLCNKLRLSKFLEKRNYDGYMRSHIVDKIMEGTKSSSSPGPGNPGELCGIKSANL